MTEAEKTQMFATAIHALIEGVEASGGIWLDLDDDREHVEVLVAGPGGLLDSRVADAYIHACQAIGREIKAEPPCGSAPYEASEIPELVKLPRRR